MARPAWTRPIRVKSLWPVARTASSRFRWQIVPLVWLLIVLLWVIVPGVFAHSDPYAPSLPEKLLPPGSPSHILGTDALGRDIFSRIVHGARPTLLVAGSSLLISLTIGVTVGLVSGLKGGIVDSFLMRAVDTVLSLPMLLLALFLVMLLGPTLFNVIIAIGLLAWARYARVIRGETLVLKEQEYVAQARVMGASSLRIMLVHLLPNVGPTLLVLTTLQVGHLVLTEASLSFLGAGIPAPTPAWGAMVADGRALLTTAWWVSFFPGLTILLLVTSLNLLGDRLRDIADPRMQGM